MPITTWHQPSTEAGEHRHHLDITWTWATYNPLIKLHQKSERSISIFELIFLRCVCSSRGKEEAPVTKAAFLTLLAGECGSDLDLIGLKEYEVEWHCCTTQFVDSVLYPLMIIVVSTYWDFILG